MQQPHLAANQFGIAAADYLSSAVHARGPDLIELAAAFAAQPSARVLDLGCGAGHASYAIAPHVSTVCAFDIAAEMLAVVSAAARERGLANIEVHQGAAEELPFAAASFDAIVSRLSAHHWRDIRAAVREMRRNLKPHGRVIMIDSMGAADALCDTHLQTIELLRDRSHVRNYTAEQWQEFFSAAGFSVESIKTWSIHIDYASWIARMRTPPECGAAIMHVWQHAPAEVREHFNVQADGSFDLQVLQLVATS